MQIKIYQKKKKNFIIKIRNKFTVFNKRFFFF